MRVGESPIMRWQGVILRVARVVRKSRTIEWLSEFGIENYSAKPRGIIQYRPIQWLNINCALNHKTWKSWTGINVSQLLLIDENLSDRMLIPLLLKIDENRRLGTGQVSWSGYLMNSLYFEVFLSPFDVRILNGWAWNAYRNIELTSVILIRPNIPLLVFDLPIRWFAQPFWEYVSAGTDRYFRNFS
jgi:hypothetical protein